MGLDHRWAGAQTQFQQDEDAKDKVNVRSRLSSADSHTSDLSIVSPPHGVAFLGCLEMTKGTAFSPPTDGEVGNVDIVTPSSLSVEIQTPYYPLSGTASTTDFEARS